MECVKINNLKNDPHIKEIRNLYVHAFPLVERAPFFRLMSMTKKGLLTFAKYLDGDKLLGFTIVYNNQKSRNFLFFAVKPECRNQGIGKQILQMVINDSDLPLYLTAEYFPNGTKESDIRVRRVNFYKRNGFLILPTYAIEFNHRYFMLGTRSDVDISNHFAPIKQFFGFFFYLIACLYRFEKKED